MAVYTEVKCCNWLHTSVDGLFQFDKDSPVEDVRRVKKKPN